MSMDWDKLRVFQAVAGAGSFTHAAEKLHLNQSSVSRQVQQLEESLGVPLFHRHARGLILTEQGEMLYQATHGMAMQLSMLESKLQDSKNKASGTLIITVAEFLGTYWLAPLLAIFNAENPEIKLIILHDDKVLNLGMREADVAIRLIPPEQPDLVQKHINDLTLGLYAGRSYVEKFGTPKHPEDILTHHLLAYPTNQPTPFHQANWYLDKLHIEPANLHNITIFNSLSGMFEAVRAGLGITSLPSFMTSNNQDFVRILPEHFNHAIPVFFVYPDEHRHSRRIELFRNFITKHAKDIE